MLGFGGAVTVRLCWPLAAQLQEDYVCLWRRSNCGIILAFGGAITVRLFSPLAAQLLEIMLAFSAVTGRLY